ncbi:HAD family hydrolase [Thermodesulfobacteriota bacterium]
MMDDDAVFEEHLHPLEPIPTGETPTGLSKIRRVKGILFDVYGTLLISRSGGKDSHAVSHNRKRVLAGVLRRYGIAGTPENLMDSLRRAIENDHDSRRQEGIDHPEVDIVQIWQRVLCTDDAAWVKTFALEYEMVVNPVYPMPGLEDLLSACRGQDLLLGIISNAQFFTPRLLERLLGASLDMCGFDPQLTFFSYRFGSAKPSCFMFELAAEIFSHRRIPTASVLYVGNDMCNDILPAKTVGFQTALFAGDRRSLRKRPDDACCRHLVPDMIVTDLRQLIVDTANP